MSNLGETILTNNNRISAIPLDPHYEQIWKNYELQQSSFWPHNKINFTEDIKAFPNAPLDIQQSTLKVLGYFAASDEIVEDIINKSELCDITIPEIKYCLQYEAMMENIHSTVYNKTIAAVVSDTQTRNELFRAVEHLPSVAKKAEWAKQWINPQKSLDHTVIGKVCVEGINFSASFAWIDWLKTQKYRFDGIFEANDEISRDEARHVTTGTLIHHYIINKLTETEAKEIIDGALEIEIQFIKEVIPIKGYLGMTQNLMIDYVRHCASILANDLGYTNLYRNTYNPFPFMTKRSLNSKTNFFEKQETNYQIFGSLQRESSDDETDPFSVNATF